MDSRHVDGITRLFADLRLSRRRAITSGGTGVAGALIATGLVPSSGFAQGATPVTGDDVELLFVQSFTSGAISSVAGDDRAYTLTLAGGLDRTVYFSDRPDRIVGTVATTAFLAALVAASDDPPNAALVADTDDGEIILIVELGTGSLDDAAGAAMYEMRLLGEEHDYQTASVRGRELILGEGHLLVDSLNSTVDIYITGYVNAKKLH